MESKKNIEKIPSREQGQEKIDKDREIPAPEKTLEKKSEEQEKKDEIISDDDVQGSQGEILSESQERMKKIDDILAYGLNDIFLSMSPEKQEEFRRKGEETRDKINQLLNKAKLSIGKIVILIRKWLSLIPKVNRYFLEKEAKIKADKIIKLKKY